MRSQSVALVFTRGVRLLPLTGVAAESLLTRFGRTIILQAYDETVLLFRSSAGSLIKETRATWHLAQR